MACRHWVGSNCNLPVLSPAVSVSSRESLTVYEAGVSGLIQVAKQSQKRETLAVLLLSMSSFVSTALLRAAGWQSSSIEVATLGPCVTGGPKEMCPPLSPVSPACHPSRCHKGRCDRKVVVQVTWIPGQSLTGCRRLHLALTVSKIHWPHCPADLEDTDTITPSIAEACLPWHFLHQYTLLIYPHCTAYSLGKCWLYHNIGEDGQNEWGVMLPKLNITCFPPGHISYVTRESCVARADCSRQPRGPSLPVSRSMRPPLSEEG